MIRTNYEAVKLTFAIQCPFSDIKLRIEYLEGCPDNWLSSADRSITPCTNGARSTFTTTRTKFLELKNKFSVGEKVNISNLRFFHF